MDLDALLNDPTSKEKITQILHHLSNQIEQEDPMLLGLSQRRILANYGAVTQIALHLLEDKTMDLQEWRLLLKDACYGLDEKTRRELQTD